LKDGANLRKIHLHLEEEVGCWDDELKGLPDLTDGQKIDGIIQRFEESLPHLGELTMDIIGRKNQ
jgi:hypothetical protein